MRRLAFLRLRGAVGRDAEWWSPATPLEGAAGGLEQAAQALNGRNPIVFVCAASVLVTRLQLPAQSRRRLARAVPYALEEQLAEDVDQLHFAVGPPDTDGSVPVAVVRRQQMDSWLERLGHVGIRPRAVLAETMALPWVAGEWTVFTETDRAFVRTGRYSGFAVDLQNLDVFLWAASESARERVERIRLLGDAAATRLERCSEQMTIIVDDRPPGPFLRHAVELPPELDPARTLNLLQGDYSPREQWSRMIGPWRGAAALLVLWIMLQGAVVYGKQLRLEEQAADLWTEVHALVRTAFPDLRKVVDPRVQVSRRLEELRAASGMTGGGFVAVMASIGPQLAAHTALEVQTINYRDGRLDLDLRVPDLQQLDRLKQTLSGASGWRVEIASARSEGDRVEGRLRLEGFAYP